MQELNVVSQDDAEVPASAIVPARRKLQSLQAIRAFAALIVVAYHMQILATSTLHVDTFGGLFSGGKRGVDVFFVLSGFIIYHVHARDFNKPDRLGRYCYNRAVRVLPALWIVTLLSIPLVFMGSGQAGAAGALSPWNLAASFLLLPQAVPALVAVSWTLKFEAFFYVVFALAIINYRLGAAVFVAWQLLTLLALFTVDVTASFYAGFYFRPILLEFGVGIACAMFVQRCRTPGHAPDQRLLVAALLLGVAVFGVACYYDPADMPGATPRSLVFCAGAALILTSLVLLEDAGRFKASRLVLALGGASYAIYLVHWSVIRIEITVAAKLGIALDQVRFVAMALIAVGVGVLFDAFIDRPIQRALRRRSVARRMSPA